MMVKSFIKIVLVCFILCFGINMQFVSGQLVEKKSSQIPDSILSTTTYTSDQSISHNSAPINGCTASHSYPTTGSKSTSNPYRFKFHHEAQNCYSDQLDQINHYAWIQYWDSGSNSWVNYNKWNGPRCSGYDVCEVARSDVGPFSWDEFTTTNTVTLTFKFQGKTHCEEDGWWDNSPSSLGDDSGQLMVIYTG